jgi:hypothetical protein
MGCVHHPEFEIIRKYKVSETICFRLQAEGVETVFEVNSTRPNNARISLLSIEEGN